MTNLSQEKRKRMLAFLNTLKENNKDDDKTLIAINEIENALNEKKYGLVWEKHEEAVDVKMRTHIPVFTEDKDREITAAPGEPYNFLLEGDNLHSLRLLEKTHKGRIDVIYIDPPYNRGENDFVYDDNYVDKDDTFKHSKWLSFMFERLTLARILLSKHGIIIINIDEHEQNNLSILMNQIFGEQNNLGEIIWNKGNPKGDAKAISTMHETIICYAKNKEEFQSLSGICIRKKPNAESIIKKAKSLYKKIGKSLIPDDVKKAIKPFGYSKEIQKDFYVKYDLELVNKEFQNWLSNQNFSGGEKAYKYIDDKGRVYRGVSMAWPNKKTAPADYFVPLVHPFTGKKCPVPSRGWRYPSTTMKKLKDQGLIIFGEDETKQPEHKYYLDENLFENVPSIYFNASSADNMLKDLDISFENAKPISEAKYILSTLFPNPKIVLDFFAGSGTTAQAVLELNKENKLDCKFILCTNNQNNICTNITYKRIKTIITGERMDGSEYSDKIPANLKYYRTDFVSKDEEFLSDALLEHVAEMIQLEHGVKLDGKQYIMVMSDEEADKLAANWDEYPDVKALYVSSNVLFTTEQERLFKNTVIYIIPDNYFDFELREVGESW